MAHKPRWKIKGILGFRHLDFGVVLYQLKLHGVGQGDSASLRPSFPISRIKTTKLPLDGVVGRNRYDNAESIQPESTLGMLPATLTLF